MIKSGAHTAHPSLETVNAQDVQKKSNDIHIRAIKAQSHWDWVLVNPVQHS